MRLLSPAASLFALSLLCGCQATPPRATPNLPTNHASPHLQPHAASVGNFDFYLLNLSWSPEYCSTHPSATECAHHPGFVLHGLWPQNAAGPYPEHCSNAPGPANPSLYADIFPDPGLLAHEWSTHGTCSGLSPDAYFSLARTAFRAIAIPASLNNLGKQTTASPASLIDQFTSINQSIPASSFAVSCGNNYLTAVEVCLGKDLRATACKDVRSCRAASIRVVPPNSSGN